jgi:hypothetical protein
MKKLIALLMACLAATASYADEIVFSNIYPQGGPMDLLFTELATQMEKQGHTVDRRFYKSCVDAIRAVSSSPANNFIMIVGGDIRFDAPSEGAKCPPPAQYTKPFHIVSGVTETSYYLTALPGFQGTTIEKIKELSATRKIRIGFGFSELQNKHIQAFVSKYPGVFVVLPYAGVGVMRPAVAAGDFDLYYGAGMRQELLAKGGVDVMVSSKAASTSQIKYMGNPEYVAINVLVAVDGSVTPTVTKALTSALASTPLRELAVKLSATPYGLGTGVSGEATTTKINETITNIVK